MLNFLYLFRYSLIAVCEGCEVSIGWIDFSKEDAESLLSKINGLKNPEAVDEIGIGQIRDAFANLFFPGTSTVQTRAKYFLIVPYILKEVCDPKFKSKNHEPILKTVDRMEQECAELLDANSSDENNEKDGLIGRNLIKNGQWVARSPSSIYWNGIKTYGICDANDSVSIQKFISEVKENSKTFKGYELLSANKDDYFQELKFPINLPLDHQDSWREGLNLDLTNSEALFLRNKITEHCQDKLLTYLLLSKKNIRTYKSFEDIYKNLDKDIPSHIQANVKLAWQFSRFVYVARVRYNYILGNEEAKEKWKDILNQPNYMMELDISNIEALFGYINRDTILFLNRFKEEFLKSVSSKNYKVLDNILAEREKEIKKDIQRLKLPKKEYQHGEWIGGKYLDYRFRIAKRLIEDINQGLNKNV